MGKALFLAVVALAMFVLSTDILLFGLLLSFVIWWIQQEMKNGH